ncbi:MAG: hypothetical protein U0599_08255 [Vicinamibacteria bacterium]
MLNIEANLKAYLGKREPRARYTSFDYCFNYFQSHREAEKLLELLRGDALQLSCLHLGFYLASWGMLRGSSELLQRSVRNFIPLVEVIANAPPAVWETDAHLYADGSCPAIFETARQIRDALPDGASDILVTKVMLGTFGCVPAFDTYFKRGFGVSTFGSRALRKVGEFYTANAEVIDRNRVHTLEFDSGAPSPRRYTRAKVIDMIFFVAGGA